MIDIDPDRDLRELFSRMKGEDRARTPLFHTVRSKVAHGARGRAGWTAVRLAAAGVAATLVATLVLTWEGGGRRWERPESRSQLTSSTSHLSWAFPTDFLLNTPGSGLLRTLPTFGSARWIRASSPSLPSRDRS